MLPIASGTRGAVIPPSQFAVFHHPFSPYDPWIHAQTPRPQRQGTHTAHQLIPWLPESEITRSLVRVAARQTLTRGRPASSWRFKWILDEIYRRDSGAWASTFRNFLIRSGVRRCYIPASRGRDRLDGRKRGLYHTSARLLALVAGALHPATNRRGVPALTEERAHGRSFLAPSQLCLIKVAGHESQSRLTTFGNLRETLSKFSRSQSETLWGTPARTLACVAKCMCPSLARLGPTPAFLVPVLTFSSALSGVHHPPPFFTPCGRPGEKRALFSTHNIGMCMRDLIDVDSRGAGAAHAALASRAMKIWPEWRCDAYPSSPAGKFEEGRWWEASGREAAAEERCLVTSGRASLWPYGEGGPLEEFRSGADTTPAPIQIAAGDWVTFRRGFLCTWVVHEPIAKRYAYYTDEGVEM
jgi:uncharacterized cupin superfamily protein